MSQSEQIRHSWSERSRAFEVDREARTTQGVVLEQVAPRHSDPLVPATAPYDRRMRLSALCEVWRTTLPNLDSTIGNSALHR